MISIKMKYFFMNIVFFKTLYNSLKCFIVWFVFAGICYFLMIVFFIIHRWNIFVSNWKLILEQSLIYSYNKYFYQSTMFCCILFTTNMDKTCSAFITNAIIKKIKLYCNYPWLLLTPCSVISVCNTVEQHSELFTLDVISVKRTER